jgi:cytochrome P450
MRAATRALDAIVYAEIARRRRGGGEGDDVLALLLSSGDLTDRELRDHIVTLLFGGHDTTSSTLSFLLYELARHPDVLARVRDEQDGVLAGAPATADVLLGGLPELDMTLDETLRLYPPVWVSPRRAVDAFEFAGHRVPAGAFVMLTSYGSHRLPDVFPDPDRFVPERFAPEARRELPPGAYIPFGGGSRICIGKRFGQLVVKAVATTVLQQRSFEALPGYRLRHQFTPTLSPKGSLPLAVTGSRAA